MSKIESIKFEVIDPIVIKKTAGCEVTSSEMYQLDNPDVPVKGGLFDLKMGTVNQSQLCATCKGTPASCPGHHGYIELEYPCYNPTFLEGNTLVYVLKSVCHNCSTLFPSKISNNITGVNRLPMYAKGVEQLVCKKCGAHRANNIKYADAEMHVRYTDMSVKSLGTETVLEMLKKMSQQDCDTLGVYHPQRMIWTVLPVIPPVTRTHAVFGGISKSADELSKRYREIIDQNKKVKEFKTVQPQNVEYQAKLLQRLVSSLTKTETRLVPGPQVAAIKSMSDLIMKKNGIIRNNLMGKRVNYSGRTVIGLDTTLALDQVGVPKFVASVLTTPEKVTLSNIQHLQTLVNLGPNSYPGATIVELSDGTKIDLKRSTSVVFLQVGHTVHRYLMDDDPVFLNRQPSLHKYSMMGHRAKVLEGNTFRVNLSANKPYNADYDGDEVNLHLPQDQLSKVELQQIANIGNLVISTGLGAPIMSIVLDALLGSFLMTLPNTVVSREDFMNMIIDFDQALLYDHSLQLRNGRDLITYALPKEVYYTGNSKAPKPLESNIIIENSKLLQGVLTGNILGTSKGELIHNIVISKGSRAASDFITGIQRIANAFMVRKGFSLGIQDALLSDNVLKQIDNLVDEVIVKVETILDKARQGVIKMCPGMTQRESLEQDIRDTAEIAVKYANSAITDLGIENNYLIQVFSKAKGDIDKLKNTMAIVGQLTIDGNRIKPGYTHRLTPHFLRYDLGLEARGFVRKGYAQGLGPLDLFFIATEQREKIIDTGLKTATSGYLQRQMVKSLEGLKVEYDGTTRMNTKNIVQFVSGTDGFDITMVQSRDIPINVLSEDMLRSNYLILNINEILQYSTQNVIEYCKNFENDILDMCHKEYTNIVSLRNTIEKTVNTPFILDMLINTAKVKFMKHNELCNINPIEIINRVNLLIDSLTLSVKKTNMTVLIDSIVFYRLSVYIKSYLSPKIVICKHKLSSLAFEWICENIMYYYRKALVHSGEMIGCLAATSLGEPLTQMTLSSVVGSTDLLIKTQGVLKKITIGEFVESVICNNIDKIHHCAEKCTTWTESVVHDPEILATDTDGNVKWCKIEGVSRHPVVNPDGSKGLIRVELSSGRTVVATKAKSFLKLIDDKIIDVNGSDLVEGDWLPVSKILCTQSISGTQDDFIQGTLCKLKPHELLNMSSSFIKGYISQLVKSLIQKTYTGFIKMPNVVCKINNYKKSKKYIFIKKDKLYVTTDFVYDLGVLLGICGIQCDIYGKTTSFNYEWIPNDYLQGCCIFNSLGQSAQRNKIPNIVQGKLKWEPRQQRFPDITFEKIIKITEVDEEEYVYDLTVEHTRNFNVYSGFCQRDTFHAAGGSAKTVNTGVPRVKELIYATKNILTPSLNVFFNKNVITDGYIPDYIISKIEHTIVDHIVDNVKYSTTEETQSGYSNDIIILQINNVKLANKRLVGKMNTVLDALSIEWNTEIQCIWDESTNCINIRYLTESVKVKPDIKHRFLKLLTERILKTYISGVPSVSRVYISKINNEPYIQTDGGNLNDLLYINEIDFTRTCSNGIHDTLSTLGIEGTRSLMISEIINAYSGKEKVGVKHVYLLVDTMTFNGNPTSVEDKGICSKSNYSGLSRCSVQLQLKYLGELSRTLGVMSSTNDVSDAVFVGKMFKGGTGMCDIIEEEEKVNDEIIDNFKLPNFNKIFTQQG